jgi:hypothetical protein
MIRVFKTESQEKRMGLTTAKDFEWVAKVFIKGVCSFHLFAGKSRFNIWKRIVWNISKSIIIKSIRAITFQHILLITIILILIFKF